MVSLLAVLVLTASPAGAQDKRFVTGSDKAPIRVDEYMSMNCGHCADFIAKTLPELEKKYVETGKVRFIMHDFPLNRDSLKAAAIARCMPEDQYLPFIKTLFSAMNTWAFAGNPEKKLVQYATLGGLDADKAKACANDKKLQDEIIAERLAAVSKYHIEATPTFVVNEGVEIINGAISAEEFSALFDRLLAKKK